MLAQLQACRDGEWLEGAARCSTQVPKSNPHHSLLIIVWHCHTRAQKDKKQNKKKHHVVILLGWSSCIERESRLQGFGCFEQTSRQAFPQGCWWQTKVTGAWVLELGVVGRDWGNGGKSLLNPSSFRRPQKESGCDWPCDCQGRSLGCCRTMRGSPCF